MSSLISGHQVESESENERGGGVSSLISGILRHQVTEIVHRAVRLRGGSPKSHLTLAWWHYHGDPDFFPTNEMAKLVRDAASQDI